MIGSAYDKLYTTQKRLDANRQAEKELNEQLALQEEERRQAEIARKRAEANWFERTMSTVGEIGVDFLYGAGKGIEGIIDFGAGIVGSVGTKDFRNTIQNFIEKDYVGNSFLGDWQQNLHEISYIDDMGYGGEVITGIASGIGQMLPAVAMAYVTGGGSVGQIASLTTLGTSAAGTGMEEAYKDGAGYYEGLGYGIISGGIEVLTEKMFGANTGGVFGKGMLDDIGESTAKTGIKRVLSDMAEEGVEEMASSIANPLAKSIYKGKDALNEYGSSEYWKDVGTSGLVGALTSAAYSGTVGYGLSKLGIGHVGIEADINDSLVEIQNQWKKAENLFNSNKLDDKNELQLSKNIISNYQNIERVLKNATPEKRASLIEKFSLHEAFNPDGSINSDFASRIGIANTNTTNTQNNAQNTLISDNFDRRYYSVGLRGNENSIKADLDSISTELSEKVGQEVTLKTFAGELTESGKTHYAKFKKAVSVLNSISKDGLSIVVVEPNNHLNGVLLNKRFYISSDMIENGTWAKTVVHEYTHFAEGTSEYEKLMKILHSDKTLYDGAIDSVLSKAYFSSEDIAKLEQIINKHNSSIDLNPGEQKLLRTYMTEVNAHMTEQYLGNDSFIDKIVNKQTSLAQKIVNKIFDLKEMFERIGNVQKQAEYKRLTKAQNLYLKAIKEAGYNYDRIARKILKGKDEDDDNVANSAKIDYNNQNGESYEEEQEKTSYSLWGESRRGSDDLNSGRVRQIQTAEITRREESFAKEIVEKSKLSQWDEDAIIDTAKDLGFSVKFVKLSFKDDEFLIINKTLYLSENITTHKAGLIFDQIAPYKELSKERKSAHISAERWDRFLQEYPNAYIANISLQSFLDLSADRLNQRAIYKETAELDENQIKDTGYPLYLKIDFGKGQSITHEGRHRVTALQRAGYTHADIFIIPVNDPSSDVLGRVDIVAERTSDSREEQRVVPLSGIIKANSSEYRSYIEAKFKNINDGNIKYSLKDSVEADVKREFGQTYNWRETGYILQDGFKLDLSGRKQGAPGGSRQVDHREIFDIYEDGDTYGTDAMIEFMARGNIRVSPEYPGINLQVEPTDAQYEQIRSLIDRVAWNEKYFAVDFDNKNGDTVANLEYENNISANKIISDIKYYFKEGKLPYKSDLSQFRYSLKDSYGVQLTEQQAEFFKDSKVRDENGNLLVVYHGTDKNFSVFDKGKIGTNAGSSWGAGFYFASDPDLAGNYGEVLEFYLNIKNPFHIMRKGSYGKIISLLEKHRIKYNKELLSSKYRNAEAGIEEDVDLIDLLYDIWSKETARFPMQTMSSILQKEGYDGVFAGNEFVVFESNQIKETTNKNPTKNDDVRFSLKDGNGKYNFSKGQIAKYVAEHSKSKAYDKSDAEKTINAIVNTQLAFGDKYGEISNKTKQEVTNMLWHALNTKAEGYRIPVALEIADYIINNAVAEDMYESGDSEEDFFVINVLRDYLHKVDLDGIRGEIKHRYDNDNSPYARWGKRKGTNGQSPDQIAQELEEVGIRFNHNNAADIFFEMDEMYKKALNNLKSTSKERLKDVIGETDKQELRQSIAREILMAFDKEGHKTRFAETIEKYTNRISKLKEAVRDIQAYNKAKNNVVSTVERMRDEFVKNKPAGWNVPEQVVNFVKKISKIETWRNDISSRAREYLRELETQLDNVLDEAQQEIYPYRDIIQDLAYGQGELSTEELRTLDAILRQFIWQLRNYDKVEFEGSAQSITNLAIKGVKESREAKSILAKGSNPLIKFKNKVYANPYDRMAEMGLYREDSITVRLYKEMLSGDRRRAEFVRDANALFDEFLKKNKSYLKDLQSEIVIGDIKMTKRQALALYATSLREQGRSHLFNEGSGLGHIRLTDNKLSTQGKTLEAFANGVDVTITAETIEKIKQSLTDADKKYLEIVDKFFNELSKTAKTQTDKKLYGLTNIESGYYFPIKVSSDKIYTEAGQNNTNVNQYVLDMGMNKTVKPNAKNKIVIDGIDNIISNHIQNMSLYYGYAIPLMAYNRIMNKQIVSFEGADATSNMRGEIQKIDTEFESYMNTLWQDVQGIRKADKGFISSLLSKIRWAGASSALGANPKVLFTQTLSLASALSEFNGKYVAKGMAHFFGEKEKAELSKYSALMWERMEIGNSVDIAEIRQIGKEIGTFGKITAKATKAINTFTTKPISWMDSNVIQSLWFAAQYEVADKLGTGYEVGTESNKIEAGKRLDEVVFRTQQTSDAIGRSEWMRSQNEFVKFARMFTGDSIQLSGRLIASVNKFRIAKKMIKSGNSELANRGQSMLKDAKIGIAKSGTAFILNQLMLLAIAMAFKWIKGKKDDEEWSKIAQNELKANLFSLIPLGGDIYDIISGYEPTNMAYTALSDTVDIATGLYNGTSALVKGEYVSNVERNAAIRKTAISISKLLGIPLQNIETYSKGIVGKFSPGSRAEYEAMFKLESNKTYINRIQKATENGDEELAETYINIMFNNKTGKIKDDAVLNITRDLIVKGYDVLPKSVNKTITYNNTTYTLSKKQYNQFKNTYSQATDIVKSMVNLSMFNRLDDEAKAKAMTFIYDYYYNLALEELTGEDIVEETSLFANAIPIEKLAIAVAQARLYTADLDSNNKVISGSKKIKVQNFIQSLKLTAVQKYMIMGYLGYSNKNGGDQVKAYINRLKLTKAEKQNLYELSGYED